MSTSNVVQAFQIADAVTSIRHVFIRDLKISCVIGVHKQERKQPQRILINIDMAVIEGGKKASDKLEDVVCYEKVIDEVRLLVARERVRLIETLADMIAELCLEDKRVRSTRVRIEKLDIFKDAASAGIEIERYSPFKGMLKN